MKKLIAISLVIGMALSLPVPYARTEETVLTPPSGYSRHTTTWTDFSWDQIGRLTDQNSFSTTVGLNDLGGENYSYTIYSNLSFEVKNGKAYETTSNSREGRSATDGEKTIIHNKIGYSRDTCNRLLIASGTRDTASWTAEMDANNDGTVGSGEGQRYSIETATLAFKNLNGEPEIVLEAGNRMSYESEEKAKNASTDYTSITYFTTTRDYGVINGVTKSTRIETAGETYFYKAGTTDGQPAKTDKSNLPYTNYTQATCYAYDKDGSILPTSNKVAKKQTGKDPEGKPIYEWQDSNGKKITDQNSDGFTTDEAEKLVKETSYSITESSGVTVSNNQKEEFTQRELTTFEVINGMAVPKDGYTEHGVKSSPWVPGDIPTSIPTN